MFAAGCSPPLNRIDNVAWITDAGVGVDQDDTGKEEQHSSDFDRSRPPFHGDSNHSTLMAGMETVRHGTRGLRFCRFAGFGKMKGVIFQNRVKKQKAGRRPKSDLNR